MRQDQQCSQKMPVETLRCEPWEKNSAVPESLSGYVFQQHFTIPKVALSMMVLVGSLLKDTQRLFCSANSPMVAARVCH